MHKLDIALDGAELAGIRAYAAARGQVVAGLIGEYLTGLARDVVTVPLPAGSCTGRLAMFRHKGRDTTAGFLAAGGWDAFERPLPQHFYAWTRAHPGVVIDGGANTGFYALLAANAEAANRVLAFEPDPHIHPLLQANVDANAMQARITVLAQALGDRAGRAPLFIPAQDHGVIETSSSLQDKFKSRFSAVVEVEVVTLDGLLAARGLAGERVSVIKADVAGHEMAVLDGAAATVARHRPVLFIEVLAHAAFGALSAFAARHDYLDVPLRPHGLLTAQAPVTFEGHAWNHALVPAEALPRFLAAAPGA